MQIGAMLFLCLDHKDAYVGAVGGQKVSKIDDTIFEDTRDLFCHVMKGKNGHCDKAVQFTSCVVLEISGPILTRTTPRNEGDQDA